MFKIQYLKHNITNQITVIGIIFSIFLHKQKYQSNLLIKYIHIYGELVCHRRILRSNGLVSFNVHAPIDVKCGVVC